MKKVQIRTVAALCIALTGLNTPASAQIQQNKDEALKLYRASNTKVNNLEHTRLQVSFDYPRRYLYGKAWLTLRPHFYSTDSLQLDAKGMDLKNISLIAGAKLIPLKYSYDGRKINIALGRKFSRNERYTVFVDYTAKPDELKTSGSAAISNAKGLYFINADGALPDKPIQIWTQGETEASSVWFPTIDSPNQKTTSEIAITVPSKYVTLSNGKMLAQKTNLNGTRTDTWKMDLPHSPYLFMMAVGDFKIYKDKWRDREVNYYLEPAYAAYAKQIFGHTPEMMEFYSQKLGVDFPWNKYSQIVVRDFVSGAMENTTATLHGDFVQKTDRELLDKNEDPIIAHELFHQWFGDYVTAESWSNLTVNESFADFGELLWIEHKFGKDAGDQHNREAMQAYFGDGQAGFDKHLVRFHYRDKEDMFDHITYKKGGRILNMLRAYLGEDAFFKGLQLYLKQHAFKNGEAHQLRLAFEEVSGQDLNWFFNQWYFSNGHPKLDISYRWVPEKNEQQVIIKQTQEGQPFILPFAVDLYYLGKRDRRQAWLRSKEDTLKFRVSEKPDLINVDAEKVLLAQKTDHKSLQKLAFQYKNAPLYMDRFEALEAAANMQTGNTEARNLVVSALNDKYEGIRKSAVSMLENENSKVQALAAPVLKQLAASDSSYQVRAAALSVLAPLRDTTNGPLFNEGLKSRSFGVQAAALLGLTFLDPHRGLNTAKNLEKGSRAALTETIATIYAQLGGPAEFPFVDKQYSEAGLQARIALLPSYMFILAKLPDTAVVNKKLLEIKNMGQRTKKMGGTKFVIGLFENFKRAKELQLGSAANEAEKQRINQQIARIDTDIEDLKKD